MQGDELIASGHWMKLFRRYGWCECISQNNVRGTVFVLIYRITDNGIEILCRHEHTPAHESELRDSINRYASISGSWDDKTNSSLECAQTEVREETGYIISIDELIDLGTIYPSKFLCTCGYLYAVEIKDHDRIDIIGDGTPGEIGASCEWISGAKAICESSCPSIGCSYARLMIALTRR